MATTRYEISEWFDRGVKQGATHLIVVCDTFDYEDYPVFVKENQDVKEIESEYSQSMQSVMEVYCLTKDKEPQLNEHRSFNY